MGWADRPGGGRGGSAPLRWASISLSVRWDVHRQPEMMSAEAHASLCVLSNLLGIPHRELVHSHHLSPGERSAPFPGKTPPRSMCTPGLGQKQQVGGVQGRLSPPACTSCYLHWVLLASQQVGSQTFLCLDPPGLGSQPTPSNDWLLDTEVSNTDTVLPSWPLPANGGKRPGTAGVVIKHRGRERPRLGGLVQMGGLRESDLCF